MQTFATSLLIGAISLIALWFAWRWWFIERARRLQGTRGPRPADTLLDFISNFFDTLGMR